MYLTPFANLYPLRGYFLKDTFATYVVFTRVLHSIRRELKQNYWGELFGPAPYTIQRVKTGVLLTKALSAQMGLGAG